MKKEKQRKLRILSNNIYLVNEIWKVCPGRVIGDILIKLLNYTRNNFYSIVFLRFILNALEKQTSFSEVVTFISISIAVFFILDIISSWYHGRYREITEQTIYENLNLNMYKHGNNVELACFENPEFYNKYTNAIAQVRTRGKQVIDIISEVIAATASTIFVLGFVMSLDKLAVVFIVIPVAVSTWLGKKINKTRYDLNMSNIPFNRKKEYAKRTIYLNNYAKEIRLSNVFNVIIKSFNDAVDSILKNIKKYGFKLGVLRSIQANINQTVILIGSFFYATFRLMVSKTLLIGDFIVLANSIINISFTLINLFTSILKLSENSLYIDNVKQFLEYEPKIAEDQDGIIPNKTNNTLTLRNVSYTYEGQNKPVLKNINIEIKPKEKIALVGHNGAGKSTLVKLMMRLYDVTEGEILLDNENVKKYKVKDYRNLFGTVFQDFKVLAMTVGENVLMRNVNNEEDEKRVITALKQSGIYDKIMSLKNGINTNLTREFDKEGAVLSGGEFQKIAISRVFANKCSIAILDEPSSALDPIAEYEIYESMMKTCEDKSVVFISHRLSSAVLADKIYLLENGQIVEAGTHLELLRRNEKYAEMFNKQAEQYLDKERVV